MRIEEASSLEAIRGTAVLAVCPWSSLALKDLTGLRGSQAPGHLGRVARDNMKTFLSTICLLQLTPRAFISFHSIAKQACSYTQTFVVFSSSLASAFTFLTPRSGPLSILSPYSGIRLINIAKAPPPERLHRANKTQGIR